MVCLVCAEYEEPDCAIVCQAISMQNQMQAFLITNCPFYLSCLKKDILQPKITLSLQKNKKKLPPSFIKPNYLQQSVLRPLSLCGCTDNLQ